MNKKHGSRNLKQVFNIVKNVFNFQKNEPPPSLPPSLVLSILGQRQQLGPMPLPLLPPHTEHVQRDRARIVRILCEAEAEAEAEAAAAAAAEVQAEAEQRRDKGDENKRNHAAVTV